MAVPSDQPADGGGHGKAPGYWEVREEQNGSQREIYFGIIPRPDRPPAAHQQLIADVERTLSALRSIFRGNAPKFDEAFNKLLLVAQAGLVGENPNTGVASAALSNLQSEIVDSEAGRVKNAYMLKLGIWSLIFALLAAIAYFIASDGSGWLAPQLYRYRGFLLLWAGCMAGTWASFATRKAILGFFDLAIIETDRIDPPLRLAFTGVLTILLGFVFTTSMAKVTVGSFETSNLLHSGATALLFGAFCGLSEQTLPAAVAKRAQEFFAAGAASSSDNG